MSMWQKGKPYTLVVRMYVGAAIMENNMKVSQKLKIELPCGPEIPLLGVHSQEMKPGP